MAAENVIVLGLGNILCGDDGFGVHAVQFLKEQYSFPECCQIIDGGTQGQLLYGIVEEADRLLLLDAADFGLAPGCLSLRRNEEIPAWLGTAKLSAHQGSFAEVLALAGLKGVLPEEIRLIGFQPADLEFGLPLSAIARPKLPEAIAMCLTTLKAWGIIPVPAANTADSCTRELRAAFLR